MAEIDGNGVFDFAKADREAELVARCTAALDHGDLTGLTPGDFRQALITLARASAEQNGRDFRSAYEATLQTDLGQRLYRGWCAAEDHLPDTA